MSKKIAPSLVNNLLPCAVRLAHIFWSTFVQGGPTEFYSGNGSICCLRDTFLFLVVQLSNSIYNNSISGVNSIWTILYVYFVSYDRSPYFCSDIRLQLLFCCAARLQDADVERDARGGHQLCRHLRPLPGQGRCRRRHCLHRHGHHARKGTQVTCFPRNLYHRHVKKRRRLGCSNSGSGITQPRLRIF